MKKITESTKVTLTLGQLKKLVKESFDELPQEIEPAIDNRLCEMIADLAEIYLDVHVDDHFARQVADKNLNSIYADMRELAMKWLKTVYDKA